MKRILLTLIALSLFAIACGSDDTSEVVSGQEPVADPTTAPAGEPILGGGPYSIGTVNFVVTNTETGEQTAMYTLSCLGDTATVTGDWSPTLVEGTLGSAEDLMCRALGEPDVQTRLIDGVADDLMCTEIYGSADFAEVTGELSGKPVATSFDRANGCGINDWDQVMAGLLPPPTN